MLLSAAAATMFLFYNPFINGASSKDLVMGNDIVKYVLGGLLAAAGVFAIVELFVRKQAKYVLLKY